jgi:peptide/nickel transport system permease protein
VSFRRYAAERTAFSVGVFVLALVVIDVVYRVLPGHPPSGFGRPREYGEFINRNVFAFVTDVLRGDLGTSFGGLNVGGRAVDASFVTMSLVIGAIVFALVVGFVVALSPWRWPVRIFSYLAFGAFSISVGLWLAYWVGFKLGWTAITGYCWALDAPDYVRDPGGPAPCEHDVREWAGHLYLPWVSLGLGLSAIYARVLRAVRLALRSDRECPRNGDGRFGVFACCRLRSSSAATSASPSGQPFSSRPSSACRASGTCSCKAPAHSIYRLEPACWWWPR